MSELTESTVEQMRIDELAEILEELGTDLSPEQLKIAARLVQQLGGIESALAALETLQRAA